MPALSFAIAAVAASLVPNSITPSSQVMVASLYLVWMERTAVMLYVLSAVADSGYASPSAPLPSSKVVTSPALRPFSPSSNAHLTILSVSLYLAFSTAYLATAAFALMYALSMISSYASANAEVMVISKRVAFLASALSTVSFSYFLSSLRRVLR